MADGLAGGHPRVGDHEVDVGLEVLGDPEVVERDGEEQRVRGDQLVDQAGRERGGVGLGRGALVGGDVRAGDGVGPRGGRDRVGAEVAA